MSTDITAAATAEAPPSTAAARPAGRGARIGGWVLIIVLLVTIALLLMRMLGGPPDLSATLHPDSAAPTGARALTQLVRDQGVDVELTTDRAAIPGMLDADTTLVLTDPYTLSDKSVTKLIRNAKHVVFLDSSARILRLLDLGEYATASTPKTTAQCDAVEFSRTGSISPTQYFTPAAGVSGCYRGSDNAAAVLRSQDDARTITLLDGTRLLSNAKLDSEDNAALGLALLAQHPRLVWYVPTLADSDFSSSEKTIGDLTPAWVTPVLLLLLLTGLAAAWWRGRRFGPLVAESLPVTVRASETMYGRAGLTAKAADAAHAGVAIRNGSLVRLAARLALGPKATAEEVADAASDRLGLPRTTLYELLTGPAPSSDAELISLARSLAELEDAVNASSHIERNRP